MGVHDLAVFDILPLGFRYLVADELMQPVNTDARLPGMLVLIVIADMKKIISIIENADTG
jgi:hypothetical protein